LLAQTHQRYQAETIAAIGLKSESHLPDGPFQLPSGIEREVDTALAVGDTLRVERHGTDVSLSGERF